MRPARRSEPTPQRETLPTQHLLKGAPYTPSHATDIKARFDAIRAAQQPAPINVSPIKKRSTKP